MAHGVPTSLPPSAKVATLKVLPARPPIWRFSVRPCAEWGHRGKELGEQRARTCWLPDLHELNRRCTEEGQHLEQRTGGAQCSKQETHNSQHLQNGVDALGSKGVALLGGSPQVSQAVCSMLEQLGNLAAVFFGVACLAGMNRHIAFKLRVANRRRNA